MLAIPRRIPIVIPVARNVWLPIFASMSAAAARLRIIAWAFAWGRGVVVN